MDAAVGTTTGKTEKKEKKESNLRFILKKAKKHRFKIIFACTLSVLSALLNLSPYFLMQSILANLIDGKVDNSALFRLVIWTSAKLFGVYFFAHHRLFYFARN